MTIFVAIVLVILVVLGVACAAWFARGKGLLNLLGAVVFLAAALWVWLNHANL